MNITATIASIADADWHMASVAGTLHFVFVFFKAFQQRNVAFMHYWWVMPISFCMASTEVFAVGIIAVGAITAESWFELVPYAFMLGLLGGLGAIVAMWLHKKVLK
jgi:hypothetical protein